MPLKFYLDKRKNKHGDAPIRAVWSFNGDRFQTTMGFSIPPQAWDRARSRVTPAAYNHKKTASSTINDFLSAMERAVNRMENYARTQNAPLTKPLVKKVVADVMTAGGAFPHEREKVWRTMLKERSLCRERYFEHFKGHRYKLICFGKDSETEEPVVIYQALYGSCEIWVRPHKMFFGKVTLPDGQVVDRFKELEAL